MVSERLHAVLVIRRTLQELTEKTYVIVSIPVTCNDGVIDESKSYLAYELFKEDYETMIREP